MPLSRMAVLLCSVSLISPSCWVSWCRVSLCWMSLSWVSWRLFFQSLCLWPRLLQSCTLFSTTLRAIYIGDVFNKNSCHSDLRFCPPPFNYNGYLRWHETNTMVSIYTMLPKMDKARRVLSRRGVTTDIIAKTLGQCKWPFKLRRHTSLWNKLWSSLV